MIQWLLDNIIEIILICILVHYAPAIYRGYKKWRQKFEEEETK